MVDARIFFELSLMLLFAIVGYLLAKRFKQPASVGIIIFGILLGPSVFGVVEYSPTLSVIAQLGSIVLLFVAGLNSDIKEIYTKRNFYMAFWGAVTPLIGGFLVAKLFNYDMYTSVFIGATLTATCLGITSAVLKEIGRIKTETAKAMIGAAVIDDIISLAVLSIIIDTPADGGTAHIIMRLALVAAFIFVMLLFGEKLFTKLFNYFHSTVLRHSPKLTFVLGISVVFLFSYLSYLLGLAPIIGAFLIGVCISKSDATNILFAGSEYFEIIFVSIFFISIGVVVELSAFYTMFWFIIALTAIAIITKILGVGIPARKMGFNSKDALIVGVGMAPRGEVAFIIALNGLLLGVITKEVYSSIVFMSFLTTIITLVALKTLYGKDPKGQSMSEEVDFLELKIRR